MEDEMNKVKLPVAGTGVPVNTVPVKTVPVNTTPANTPPANTAQQAKSILTAATGIAGKSGIITAIETSELKPELKQELKPELKPTLDLKLKADPKLEQPRAEPKPEFKAEPKLEQSKAEPELKTRIHKIFPFQTLIFAICLICFIIFFYYSR